jgi:hypothetical protein
LSEEEQQKASLEAREKEKLRAEERILKQREVRKQRAKDIENGFKAKAERDLRETELRRKIQERKDREAEEEKRSMEE